MFRIKKAFIITLLVVAAFAGGYVFSTEGKEFTRQLADEISRGAAPEARQYKMNLEVDFKTNLLLSRYGVDVYVDDRAVGTLKHGEDYDGLVEVGKGVHTIEFRKKGDDSVVGQTEANILDDSTVKCRIKTRGEKISVWNTKTVLWKWILVPGA